MEAVRQLRLAEAKAALAARKARLVRTPLMVLQSSPAPATDLLLFQERCIAADMPALVCFFGAPQCHGTSLKRATDWQASIATRFGCMQRRIDFCAGGGGAEPCAEDSLGSFDSAARHTADHGRRAEGAATQR
jgi:hypothetical protein